ncbi:MAG: hypothetical protein ACOZNI_37045 [Myxococcota bacterium]
MLLALLLACTGGDGEETGAVATIRIVSPEEDDVVCGAPLHVVTEVEGLELVDPYEEGGDPAEGTGHVDSYVNGQDATMSGTEEFDIVDVGDGVVQLKVELSKADHTAIEPYAGHYIYVTVDNQTCGS